MGIIAFIFTVWRFYQDHRPLKITSNISPFKFPITIFDENDNPINEESENCFSIELTLYNKSLRATTIKSISHNSSFEFHGYSSAERIDNFHEVGIIVTPGAIIEFKNLIIPLDQKSLNVEIQTTHGKIKRKVRITNN